MFYKISVLKNFTKLTGKKPVLKSFEMKLQASGCNFIKKKTPALVFSKELCDIFDPIQDGGRGGGKSPPSPLPLPVFPVTSTNKRVSL